MERCRFVNCFFCFLAMVLLVITYRCYSEAKHFNTIAGPARFVVRKAESCKQTSRHGDFVLHMRPAWIVHTDKYAYSGYIVVPVNVNDTFGVRVTLASWNSVAGWRENAFVLNFPNNICSIVLKSFITPIANVVKNSIFGELQDCPYLAGFYVFQNVTAALDAVPIKQFAYGRWRVSAKGMEGHEPMACFNMIIDSVPK